MGKSMRGTPQQNSARQMRVRRIRVQGECLLDRNKRLLLKLGIVGGVEEALVSVGSCQVRLQRRKIRSDLDCLFIQRDGLILVLQGRKTMGMVAAAEVQIVSARIQLARV